MGPTVYWPSTVVPVGGPIHPERGGPTVTSIMPLALFRELLSSTPSSSGFVPLEVIPGDVAEESPLPRCLQYCRLELCRLLKVTLEDPVSATPVVDGTP